VYFKHCLSILIPLTLLYDTSCGQSFPGFETGRFSGISSATLRPGGMAPMPFKVDATLFGIHLNSAPKNIFGSDALDVIFSGGFKNLSGFDELRKRTSVFSNLQGPSLQVEASEKVSVGFAWNLRHLWLSDFSEPRVASLFGDEPSAAIEGVNESAHVLYTGWDEFALGAAGVLWEEAFHKFSAGGFVKLVFGTGNMNTNIDKLNVSADAVNVNHLDFDISAKISDNLTELIDDGKLHFADKPGYGFDLGAEYRMISLHSCPGASNYRLKAGFALNDIGKAFYKSATVYSKENAAADSISRDVFHNTFANTTDTLQKLFEFERTSASDYSMMLPMSFRVYTEVNIRRRAVIYGEFHFLFAQLSNPELPLLFRFNLTPRFEDDRYGIYLPMTFTNYIPADVGLAIRLKPLVIGSGNLFSFWAYEERGTSLDLFVVLKIPILNDDERIDWKTMGKRARKRI